jgi:glucosamine-6-phosphate deaminase
MTSTIDTEKMFAYCRIPMENLENHPDARAKIKIFNKSEEVNFQAAQIMIDEIVENNRNGKPTRWVLPCGPNQQFEIFINYINENDISLENLHVFLMDDYLDWNCRPFPEDHPYFNNTARFKKMFYDKIKPELNVPIKQRHAPLYNDLDAMDDAIEALGGLDTVFGGLGFKGLVAYCEAPLSPFFTVTKEQYCNMKTRIYPINDDTTIAYSVRKFGGLTHMNPPLGVSIGFKSMLMAKKLVLMCTTGAWKRTAIRVMLFNEPTVEYPATLFTEKVPECLLLCDKNTAESPLPPL